MSSSQHPPRIFLSAGEASGEQYGVQLMEAILRREPQASFVGLGGRRMQALGLERIVRAEDVAVMGITEILRHIPSVYREYRRLKASLASHHPDVAVLIDFPDVNLGLARACKRLGIPVIFFVSPQVWAWKKHRLKQIRRNVDQMLVIFPFEEAFYREHGVAASFVGHPLAELPLPTVTREAFAARYSLNPLKRWIGLLPGSRPGEIHLNLPGMVAAAAILQEEADHEWLLPLASTLAEKHVDAVAAQIRALGAEPYHATTLNSGPGEQAAPAPVASENTPGGQTPGDQKLEEQVSALPAFPNRRPALNPGHFRLPRITLVRDARATLYHADASVVASGTATVEAALIGKPFLVVYRVSRLTYAIARRVVTVPHVAMANLVAGRRAVPELIQHDFTPANVASALRTLLNDPVARQTMQAELARIGKLLTATHASTSSAASSQNSCHSNSIEAVATATLAAAAVFQGLNENQFTHL